MELVKIYECLCDRTRLRILHLLGRGPLCVCHFQDVLREPQVKISKHLGYLRARGMVRCERQANWMVYSLPARPPRELAANLACLQDCAQDYHQLDRVYLPLDMLRREGARVEDLGQARATQGLRNCIQNLADRADRLLDSGEEFTTQIRNRRLAREIAVIIALARNSAARLRVEDPLQGGGRTRKPQALFITLATLLRSLTRTTPTLQRRTLDDAGV